MTTIHGGAGNVSIKIDKQPGDLYTVTLPATKAVGRFGSSYDLAEITFFATTEDRNSTWPLKNALELLQILYSRNVVDPDVLTIILEATGHREKPREIDELTELVHAELESNWLRRPQAQEKDHAE